jgi:hypothetical protein
MPTTILLKRVKINPAKNLIILFLEGVAITEFLYANEWMVLRVVRNNDFRIISMGG